MSQAHDNVSCSRRVGSYIQSNQNRLAHFKVEDVVSVNRDGPLLRLFNDQLTLKRSVSRVGEFQRDLPLLPGGEHWHGANVPRNLFIGRHQETNRGGSFHASIVEHEREGRFTHRRQVGGDEHVAHHR